MPKDLYDAGREGLPKQIIAGDTAGTRLLTKHECSRARLEERASGLRFLLYFDIGGLPFYLSFDHGRNGRQSLDLSAPLPTSPSSFHHPECHQ